MNSKVKKYVLLAVLVYISILGANVQVNAQEVVKGTRIPQLTTLQRNSISDIDVNTAKGQAIYNTDNNCFEYWNGVKWISLCIGRANISLESSCGTPYDETNPPVAVANGEQEECIYTPIDDDSSNCIVPGGQAYQVYLTAGANYTTLSVDDLTSEFSLVFSPNNSVNSRIAVVRVINNCSGEFEDFMFIQEGASCPANANSFTVKSENKTVCGRYGAVIAYIEAPQDSISYLWEYGGVVVHTGHSFEITRAGTYTVYAGLVGCQVPTPQKLIIARDTNSLSAPVVYASNKGILCSGSDVVLTADNVTGANVKWFHNGVHYPSGNGQGTLTLNGSSAAGEWFAVQQKGDCSSRGSDKVLLVDRTTTGVPLAIPQGLVNDEALSGDIVICNGGSLELKVANTYAEGTAYEWFDNGQSIGITNDALIYVVPAGKSSIQLSVQVSDNDGSCPVTAISKMITISDVAHDAALINNGASTAHICGNNGTALSGANMAGIHYEWFFNGKEIIGDSTLIILVKDEGLYTMRFKDNNGCWSPVSNTVRVQASSKISLAWFKEPSGRALVNSGESYSIIAIPNDGSYKWISSDTAVAKVTATGNGQSVNVDYTGDVDRWDSVNIRVEVSNACGTVSLDKSIDIVAGCDSLSVLHFIPDGTISKIIDASGKPETDRDSMTIFYAEIVNSSSVENYLWYENGILKKEGPEPYFIYATPQETGSYEISVVAVNGCNMAHDTAKALNTAVVRVIQDIPTDLSGDFILSGKTCFDVKRSNDNMTCMPHASRVDYFANTKTFTYKFTKKFPDLNYTDLVFAVYDPYVLLKSGVTWNDNIATLTFRDDINEYVRGTTKNDARTMILIAQYKVGDVQKEISIEISVQDCSCGCAVKSTLSSGWLTFLCYNLGADQSKATVDEQTAYNSGTSATSTDATVYGALYQWGRKTDGHESRASALTTTIGGFSGDSLDSDGQVRAVTGRGRFVRVGAAPFDWRSPQSDVLWNNPKTVGDPCPEGWRVPTSDEWCSIFNGSEAEVTNLSATANNTMTGSGNVFKYNAGNNQGTRGWKISPNNGTDFTLFLPFGGYRNYNGALSSVYAQGEYWHSRANAAAGTSYRLQIFYNRIRPSSSTNANVYRAYGASVRCVRDE